MILQKLLHSLPVTVTKVDSSKLEYKSQVGSVGTEETQMGLSRSLQQGLACYPSR